MGEPTFPDLRSFIERLRRDGDLLEIDVPVDPRLEIAEIHRRVIETGGPALLFTRPRNSSFPVATNLFGTARRAELAFGDRPFRLIRRIAELATTVMPPSPGKLWRARDVAGALLRVGARRGKSGPVVDQVSGDLGLDRLPALTTWPGDGGPFLTLPLVYTEHPENGSSNLAIYRMQIHDPRTAGMHWQIGKGGGFHYARSESLGRPLPATVFLGGPPALTLAAVAPLPENTPELMLASLIVGRRLGLVQGVGPHPLVADAEFALIGRVPAGARRPEGPFGDHYGYYSLTHDYPVFEVEHMAHGDGTRSIPRQWSASHGRRISSSAILLQELLSPLFPLVMPAVDECLVLRRDRLSLPGRRHRTNNATSGRPWPRRSGSWARDSSR